MTFLGPDTDIILSCAAFAVAVLGTGGLLTEIGPWYLGLRKPSWQPPNWLFGPAWTVIAVLSCWAGVHAWKAAPGVSGRVEVVTLFLINGLLNIGWSLLFFKLHRPDWALIEVIPLWLSVAALIAAFAPFSASASCLLLPYAVWVLFAAVLNRKIVQLNQPFSGRRYKTDLGSQT